MTGLTDLNLTAQYLRDLCQAYTTERIERRTYILERRRLIDELVAGKASAPPAIPEEFEPEATMINLDATMQLPRRLLEEDE